MGKKWTRLGVEEFISRFERGVLPRAEWTHEAHLVAGFWYLRTLGAEHALAEMRVRIRNHNESAGTPNTDNSGYHETLTRLFLQGIHEQVSHGAQEDFEESLVALLGSDLAKSTWPLAFYSRERLFSIEARKAWVAPDLLP